MAIEDLQTKSDLARFIEQVLNLPPNLQAQLAYVLSASGTLPGTAETYTATNVTTDRAYDANATTLDELADVLGTLIADLRARGVVA